MSPVARFLARRCEQVAAITAQVGLRVDVADLGVLDREGHLPLDPPGRISSNRACRLVRAADGWIAANLAREEDRDLVPAWLHGEFGEDPWDQVERLSVQQTCAELVAAATLLGLPVGAVGEARQTGVDPIIAIEGPEHTRPAGKGLKVVDLSAMWAGPMCGAILAAMGAEVIKIESVSRPDPTRTSTPGFFHGLNGAKGDVAFDFTDAAHRSWLREEVVAADIVIFGARPRALAGLGLDPRAYLREHPGGVWVSVTGYGWYGPPSERVAFGDDASAAGGLVGRDEAGAPRFLGDALADPITGLSAAIGALTALMRGGGRVVAASLAGSASGAAFELGLWR